MRLNVTPQRVELIAGATFTVSITVTNTGDLIGGYHLHILGADPSWVRLETENLSLFPDTSQTVTATITIPEGLGAGDRRIAVQVREITPPQAISVAEIDVLVPSRPALRMSLTPMTVICGGTGRFTVMLENTGNTTITAKPVGLDPQEKIAFTFAPAIITLAPGEHAITDLRAKATRRWLGTPVVRTFSVAIAPQQDLTSIPAPMAPAGARHRQHAPAKPVIEPLATGTMLQNALVARGALSLLSLLLAATVLAVVMSIALSGLVGVSAADRDLAIQVAAARDSSVTTDTSTLSGTVTLLTSGAAAPGVAVKLFAADSLASPLISTATDDKGHWTLPFLAAGSYKLRFRGAGLGQTWYPAALTGEAASAVQLDPGQRLNLAMTLSGLPATVSGTVLGDDVAAATLTLSVPADCLRKSGVPPSVSSAAVLCAPMTPPAIAGSAATDSAGAGAVVLVSLPIAADGNFSLPNLPSPAVYELTVSKAGYATATQRIQLSGGQDLHGVQLALRTGDGLISGTVTGTNTLMAGAKITATNGQTTVSTQSLTKGAVGTFILRGLITPGTYTVAVTKPGYATTTSTLTLAAGQRLTGVQMALVKSSGSLTGLVTLLPGGDPALDVDVTITNGATTVSTLTQSTGAWSATGLPGTGTYTVTFTRPDLQSQTLAVSLDASSQLTSGTGTGAGGLTVGMRSAAAQIHGNITQRAANGATQGAGEVAITLSSVTNSYTVTSASLPSTALGYYDITGIIPGTYTLSANRTGTSPTTVMVTVTAGQDLQQNLLINPAAAINGHVKDRTGADVPGLQVDLYQAPQYPATIYRSTTTDASGAYTFADIDAPQAYVVQVSSSSAGVLGSATLVLAASQPAVLDLLTGNITPTATAASTPSVAPTTSTISSSSSSSSSFPTSPTSAPAPSTTPSPSTTPTTTGAP